MRNEGPAKTASTNRPADEGLTVCIQIREGAIRPDLRIHVQGGPNPAIAALIGSHRDAGLRRIEALADRVRNGEPEALEALMADARAGQRPDADRLRAGVWRAEPGALRIALGAPDDVEEAPFAALVERIRAGDDGLAAAVWAALQERHTRAVALLIDRLRAKDERVQARVFDEFAGRLRQLARSRLYRRVQQIADPEDAVISAYASFFKTRVVNREFFDYNHLWAMLAVIVVRKCCKHNRQFDRDDTFDDPAQFEWVATSGVEPSVEVTLTDLVELLVDGFEAEADRQAVGLYLDGVKAPEIARRLMRSETGVRRVIQRLRKRVERMGLAPPARPESAGGD
jgi:DNA-directed RNA polymerase specialized sigma24 family protein